MSGTLYHDRKTFRQLYGLEVVRIPTHAPVRRIDARPLVFRTQSEAMAALIEDAIKASNSGAPVLIGTTSVSLSEGIGSQLSVSGMSYNLLNARQTTYEATKIMQAGYPGQITIATNMAGRGTDIVPGGTYSSHLANLLDERGLKENVDQGSRAWSEALEDARELHWQARETVLKAGGLHVLGLGLQSSRRLDQQLIGRTGRQGDPGYSRP